VAGEEVLRKTTNLEEVEEEEVLGEIQDLISIIIPPKKNNQPKENRKAPVLSSPTLWPPLPSAQSKSANQNDLVKYPKDTIISIIQSIKEDINPNLPTDCPAVSNEYLNELACQLPIPPNTKIEWIEPQARSRKNSQNVNRPRRSSSKNQDSNNSKSNEENMTHNKDQPNTQSIPTGAWQNNSSSVKTPPTQQQKNLLKPQNKKRKAKVSAKYQKKPETQSQVSSSTNSNTDNSHVSGGDTTQSGSANVGGSGSLSYADIARSTPSSEQ